MMKFFLIQQIVPLLLTVVLFSIADNDEEKFLNEVITIEYYGKPFTGTYRELRALEHKNYCTGKYNQSDCMNKKKEKRAWDCMWENGICVPGAVRPLDDDPPPENNGKKKQRKNKKKTNGKKRFRFF